MKKGTPHPLQSLGFTTPPTPSSHTVRFSLRRLDLSAVAARRFSRIIVAAIVVDFVVVVGKADPFVFG